VIDEFENDLKNYKEFNIKKDLENLIKNVLDYRVKPNTLENAIFKFTLPYSHLLNMVMESQLYPSYHYMSKSNTLFLKWMLDSKINLRKFFGSENIFEDKTFFNDEMVEIGKITILCSKIFPVLIKYNKLTQIFVCSFTFQVLRWENTKHKDIIIGYPKDNSVYFARKEVEYKLKNVKVKEEKKSKKLRAKKRKRNESPIRKQKRRKLNEENIDKNEEDEELIGKRIKIFWPNMNNWFIGTVIRYNSDYLQHEVLYEDEPEEEILEKLTGRRKSKYKIIN